MEPMISFRYDSIKDLFTITNELFLVVACCTIWILLRKLWDYSKVNRPPGPMGLPLVGYLPFLGKEPHKKLRDMSDKYDDIIGLNLGTKYTVILNEFSIMKEILCHTAALDRAPNLFDHIPELGFITENGEKWLEQRRFCLSTARDLGLGKGHWEDLIMEEASEFVNKLEGLKGQPTDISHKLANSVTSNIVTLLMGRRLREDEAQKIQLSIDFSDVSFTYMGPSNPTSVIPGLRKVCEYFKIAGYDRALRIISQFSQFVRDEISLHKTSPMFQDAPDFINAYLEKLSHLAATKNEKHYFSESMLEGNVKVLFLGASDTIMSSMGWLLRLMVKHKDVQAKVYAEVMEVIGKDGRARYEERNKFPYTFAVVMESQRYSSIVPLSTTRVAAQDIKIKGYTIPKGTEIVANLWALHNDSRYWENPEEFKPERFLTDGGTKLLKNPPSYAPFSIGRRNCPGETIAWMEILFYFTEIIKRFEISTAPGTQPEFEYINGLVAHLVPQPLCFKNRINTN